MNRDKKLDQKRKPRFEKPKAAVPLKSDSAKKAEPYEFKKSIKILQRVPKAVNKTHSKLFKSSPMSRLTVCELFDV